MKIRNATELHRNASKIYAEAIRGVVTIRHNSFDDHVFELTARRRGFETREAKNDVRIRR